MQTAQAAPPGYERISGGVPAKDKSLRVGFSISSLVPFVVGLALAGCDVRTPDVTKATGGTCLGGAIKAPAPWTFAPSEASPDLLRDGEHFEAPVSAFATSAPRFDVATDVVFAKLISCRSGSSEDLKHTPCAVVSTRGKWRGGEVSTEGSIISNGRSMRSKEGDLFGVCDGVDVFGVASRPGATCRIWLAGANGNSGLYLVVPAAAAKDTLKIVNSAKDLLNSNDNCNGEKIRHAD